MTFNAKLTKNTYINAKVDVQNGALIPVKPITIKNIVQEQQINSIEDLPDVSEVAVANGATLVYNASNDLYEIKQIDIDGGTF